MSLQHRSEDLEIMDDLQVSGEVVDQTLRELDVINQWLGGNAISIKAFRKMLNSGDNLSLADLGCGSGEILKTMAKRSRKQDKKISYRGFDANPNIIQYAKNRINGFDEINFICEDILSPSFAQKEFDIIHCCLFLHHFEEDQLIRLFRQFKEQVRIGVIVNDLHRHPLAYWGIKLLTNLFSKSAMVKYDAPLSVKKGFKKKELIRILGKAGISDYRLTWKWAFRWELVY